MFSPCGAIRPEFNLRKRNWAGSKVRDADSTGYYPSYSSRIERTRLCSEVNIICDTGRSIERSLNDLVLLLEADCSVRLVFEPKQLHRKRSSGYPTELDGPFKQD